MTLDEWSDDEIDSMIEVGGNSSANSIYEAFIPDGFKKPRPDASHDERSKYIRSDMICNPRLNHIVDLTSMSSSVFEAVT